jgi:peptidoglycan L-alanyl-D-glutamate endopeptidase CwlK
MELQASLFARGRNISGDVVSARDVVTYTRAGYSWHNHGLAYDVVLLTEAGTISWDVALDGDMDGIRDWQELGLAGESVGLTWGGRWAKLRDYAHFEYHPNFTISEALELTRAGAPIPDGVFGIPIPKPPTEVKA